MIIRKNIDTYAPLTDDQKKEFEALKDRPIEFDVDCPDYTEEQLAQMIRVGRKRHITMTEIKSMNDILEYKGYKGIVKSEESGSFSGEVIGIKKSLILFEGEDMDSLIQDFHNAVDDYLSMCEAHGREPEKPSRQFVRELLSVYLRNEMEYKDERENLKYKGYIGSVESQDDNTYYGKVLGIKALIAYEGASVEELIEDFHGAVDDYLSVCEAEGIEAETSCTDNLRAENVTDQTV